ncbi:hypothetical protein M513_13881 [Trichuris suis]|uniref:Uncharacterized protein n=1 Tax=Trichuris suis TaxID=68888 RepID=A0A085LJU6_9BILA|nr:hypothetical protein M513_13881 [Trichuris suis]
MKNKKNFLHRFSELSGLASTCRQGMDRSIEEQLQNHKMNVEEELKRKKENTSTLTNDSCMNHRPQPRTNDSNPRTHGNQKMNNNKKSRSNSNNKCNRSSNRTKRRTKKKMVNA